jgi:hypothetical protein
MKHHTLRLKVWLIVMLWQNITFAAPVIPTDSFNPPNPNSQSTANPMKLSITKSWSDATVQLLVAGTSKSPVKNGESILTPAKAATYSVTSSGSTKVARSLLVSVFTDPYTKRTYIVRGASPGLKNIYYVSSSSGVLAYEVGPGVLIWQDSYVSIAGGGGQDIAIAQFEAQFDGKQLDDILINAGKNNRIPLQNTTPLFFFSDGPAPGGGLVIPVVDSVDLTDDIMHLVLHNPKTTKSATFWIDLKAKKVVRSVVDGQEMDLTTGKSFAVPLKKS